jgi:hypothetical protein
MPHLRFFGSAVLTTLTIAIPSISTGQTQTPPSPEWSVITTTQIKPEFRQEYEAVQKEITAAYKKAGVPYRYVVQTLLGDIWEYTAIAPLGKLAEMDGPSPLVKAVGEAGSQRILRKVGGYVQSTRRVTALAMNDISIRTPGDPGEFAHITTMRIAAGKGPEFIAFMKDDYLPAMRKADVANLWLSQPIFGGDLNERVMVRVIHKIGELDEGPLTRKALGVEGAQKLSAKLARIVESTHFTVVHLRTDLSLMPAPEKPKATAAK